MIIDFQRTHGRRSVESKGFNFIQGVKRNYPLRTEKDILSLGST